MDATSKDSYDKLLSSSAAKQQLIEFYATYYGYDPNATYLNGRTISQGYSQNSGSFFFQ